MRRWIASAGALVLAMLLGACAGHAPTTASGLTLQPATFDRLAGWHEDHVSAALPAFIRSCARLLTRPGDAPLDPRSDTELGVIADWRGPCAAAAGVSPGDDRAARAFFEASFMPLLAGDGGSGEGLFTGYFEIELEGSRRRQGRYQIPLYRRPPDPAQYSRAEIENGALAGQGLELLWVDDPIAAFFLEIQGSGQVRLRDGEIVRVGYDGSNGGHYVAVGALLVQRGEVPREKMSMQAIRTWMLEHPRDGAALRQENPSYVFFREVRGEGPIGSQGVALTPGRSLAVDRSYIPLGMPVWLEAEERFTSGGVRRLLVTQDTGGAIKGPVRGDVFWGAGDAAQQRAGTMNATGRYYLLVPRGVAQRVAAGP